MLSKNAVWLVTAVAGAGAGCGSSRPPAADPTESSQLGAPQGATLAFGAKDGDLRNYFHRQGPTAVHLLTRSGTDPRLIAAFPAGNQGIGLWFTREAAPVELWAGAAGDADLATGGGLASVVRRDSTRVAYGVRATLHSDAASLTAFLALLGNLRTLRDYGYGMCLENAGQFPALRNEVIEALAGNAVRIRREQIGGGHAMELLIEGRAGTRIAVASRDVPPRPACAPGSGGAQQVIELSGSQGITVEIVALSDEAPLTPIDKPDLFLRPPPDSFELDALAFLSYAEKLEAGSWRFLTYFGRDTLLSMRMLMPRLRREVVEAALGAVIERINLAPDRRDPSSDRAIDVGDVAHEEEIGDYAAWRNSQLGDPPADLRQPRYDYKMIDDDFELAPVIAAYRDKLVAGAVSPATGEAAFDAFLARRRGDGASFRAALAANLALVLARARPFADDPRPPALKRTALVALQRNAPVGQWRDSRAGIAFGRYPFDVNAGLVPGALESAAALYTRSGQAAQATEARRLLAAWQGVDELFRVDSALAEVRANVASYARATGIRDTSAQLAATEPGGGFSSYGISLDAAGAALPVLHTDHSFVMEFARPSDAYLVRVARTIAPDFPAGLMSSVGVMVANPALAPPELAVTDPGDPPAPSVGARVALRALYTSSQYHGTVVWSWQQALLAAGIRRQIERTDIAADTRSLLLRAECKLWRAIDAAPHVRAGELWSWAAGPGGQLEYRPFGYNLADVDESNAAQLWSTVFLAIEHPSAAQNALCPHP